MYTTHLGLETYVLYSYLKYCCSQVCIAHHIWYFILFSNDLSITYRRRQDIVIRKKKNMLKKMSYLVLSFEKKKNYGSKYMTHAWLVCRLYLNTIRKSVDFGKKSLSSINLDKLPTAMVKALGFKCIFTCCEHLISTQVWMDRYTTA